MYVAGRDHPLRAPALRFLERVQAGEIEAVTSAEVLQEILFRYSALRRLDIGRDVYDLFVQLCTQVLPVTLADTDQAKALLASAPGLGARDAVHAGVMKNNGLEWIASFDAGFDAVKGIRRMPLEAAR
jgi:predicted nucleic acid-binding protein